MEIEDTINLGALRNQSVKGLNSIVNWWTTYGFDSDRNRFYGEVSNDNTPNPSAPLIIIQRARLLWFFSTLSQLESFAEYKIFADNQYLELINHFYDNQFSGFIWEVDCNYVPTNKRKQTYAQAFCIYALSEYYALSGNEEAKLLALETFENLETKAWDNSNDGYIEALDQKWAFMQDMRLSPKDKNEPKTMNTHLHVLEAYTTLAKVATSHTVEISLARVLRLYSDKFFNKDNHHFHLFFDKNWKIKSNIISFGHDIESAWLMQEAAEVIHDRELQNRMKILSLSIADNIMNVGLSPEVGVKNEIDDSNSDDTFDWWPQAEAVIGYINAYEVSNDPKYLEVANGCMRYIQKYFLNEKHGEWYWKIDHTLKPVVGISKSNGWKAPYHNGRMYLEILKRSDYDKDFKLNHS